MHQAEKVNEFKVAKASPAEEASDFDYSELCKR